MLRTAILFMSLALSAHAADERSFNAEYTEPSASSLMDIYEDQDYKFSGHGYGRRGEDGPPSFYAFSLRKKKWIKIFQVSTRGAVLGRSPDLDKLPLSVGWDHSRLKDRKYADFPLITGAVLLPDRIEYDAEKAAYALYVGARYGEHSNPTIFYLRKSEIDACFAD